MCKASEYAKGIKDIFKDETHEYYKLNTIIRKCDLKTQDLLHKIELTEIGGMYNAYLLVRELKEVRQIRRQAKDEIYFLNSFNRFKRIAKKEYNTLLQSIEDKQKAMEVRKYNIRVPYKITIKDYI